MKQCRILIGIGMLREGHPVQTRTENHGKVTNTYFTELLKASVCSARSNTVDTQNPAKPQVPYTLETVVSYYSKVVQDFYPFLEYTPEKRI